MLVSRTLVEAQPDASSKNAQDKMRLSGYYYYLLNEVHGNERFIRVPNGNFT
jgi:hypothetical protein